ncbi:MAG: hypothetical protein ACE141_16110 [Bryobacteraceae bacterium]
MRAKVLGRVLLCLPVCLVAQEPAKPVRYNGNGYAYFNAGACQHGYRLVGVGGGGEFFLWRGLTLGGDIGHHRFSDGWGFSLATLDVGYHFVNRRQPKRIDPFVTFSALGVAVSEGITSAGHLGGGLNYWFKSRVGLHAEVRLTVVAAEEAITALHIGVSFR